MENPDLQEVFHAFRKLSRLMNSREVFGDVPRAEFFVLHMLGRHAGVIPGTGVRGMTVTALSSALSTPPPAVSKLLRTMERKGYTARVLDDNDRRVVYASLTDEGLRVVKRAEEVIEDRTRALFERLGEEDTQSFVRILRRLLVLADETSAPAGGPEPQKGSNI